MKIFLLSALLFTFVGSFTGQGNVCAQRARKPYTAKVITMENKQVRGLLQAADDKGLHILPRNSKEIAFINSLQIREIKLRRKSKVGTGTTIGLLTGLAIGGGAYGALHNNDRLENTIRGVGVVLFTFTTSAIGGAISSRPDEVFRINGRNEDYLQVLNRLQNFIPAAN